MRQEWDGVRVRSEIGGRRVVGDKVMFARGRRAAVATTTKFEEMPVVKKN